MVGSAVHKSLCMRDRVLGGVKVCDDRVLGGVKVCDDSSNSIVTL